MAVKVSTASEQKWYVRYYWIWIVIGFMIGMGAFLIFGQGGDKKQESGLNFPEEDNEEIPILIDSEVSAGSPTASEDDFGGSSATEEVKNQEVVGSWRVYSERLFYDEGGAGTWLSASEGNAVTQGLRIKSDGNWEYGSSSGKWSVSDISGSDWTEWGISSYGPVRKIVLQDWNGKGKTASGPLEESERVNFIWVLYKVGPPTVQKPGTVNIKFGH